MLLVGFFSLLLLADGATSEGNCTYQDILNHLHFKDDYSPFYMSRPVKDHKSATVVNLDLRIYAILQVKEKEQIFVPYVWITMWWKNDYTSWDPEEFCGIEFMSIPTGLMWKPDVTVVEMTERDKVAPSPYLTITHRGNIEITNDQVLTSTCRMQVYKFPFDIQSCHLTFKSFIHTDKEIKLLPYLDSSNATKDSSEVMRIQSEWLFINMAVTSKTADLYGFNQSLVVYTINMKRRSALYIVNFILPILFLLCLDLASFLVSDSGGEKLGFKVTVLLAVTVMQLILNEILPSSSNRIPLIAVYCIGVFTLMMLSLLETVLVMHLIGKDSAPRDKETEKDRNREGKREFNKLIHLTCYRDVFPGESPTEVLPVAKKDSTSRLREESTVSDELREVMKTLTLLLDSRKEEQAPGYWTGVAQKINKAFSIFYVTAASLFLLFMVIKWNYDGN
ncbi:5-hydroxytryptamine receptor 3A-like isoform X1 [Scophthalmus maximus]|uniref:5-hydroxytryptamine receptor 3A-like n=1 Tax=Scophthalmus maximus TaxID=52904 RepID=A0A8D2ZYM3_SCOMX|nr:5-hydroxytryptamine receptor 3A-like isoform X1 [Scophthalmus maximus]